MSSYSEKEINVLEYIVDNINTSDYKFMSSLLKIEFNNIRSETAYLSRLYKINGGEISNKIINYYKLEIKHPLLKKLLEPEIYSKEESSDCWEYNGINLIQEDNINEINIKSTQTISTGIQTDPIKNYNMKLNRSEYEGYKLQIRIQRNQLLRKVGKRDMEIHYLKNKINELKKWKKY